MSGKSKADGALVGSGRPPKPPGKLSVKGKRDPLAFLLGVMTDETADAALRVRAAIAAAQYTNTKRSDGGKKEEIERDAQTAGRGKFAAAAAPRLVVVPKG